MVSARGRGPDRQGVLTQAKHKIKRTLRISWYLNPECTPKSEVCANVPSPEKRGYRQVESRLFPGFREADLFFSGLERVVHSTPEQLDIQQLSRGGSSSKVKAAYCSQFCYSVVITRPSKSGGDLAPTEGWSHGSQNCLHDMRIVGDT
jgi:hypothetical protein